MKVRIHKWGNSLALRIPEAIAVEARLKPGSVVELSLMDGKIVLLPEPKTRATLEELLAGITEENLHGEIDMGPPVGKEIVPFDPTALAVPSNAPRIAGLHPGAIRTSEDFDEPLPDEFWLGKE